MSKLLCLYAVVLALCISGSSSALSCKNEDNQDVDWYIILKFPASYNYFYLSSASNTGKWITPNFALNDNKNLLSLTLTQMYNSRRNGAFYALYNDEKPRITLDSGSTHGGHLKGSIIQIVKKNDHLFLGVVNFDSDTGYWLVHSVPKFPSTSAYNYTNGESMNGQSFLCVSLDLSHLKSIASQLLMMYANVYDFNIPPNYTSDEALLDKLYKLVTNDHKPGLQEHRVDFSTLKGLKLSHFGKSGECYKDLYYDIIRPAVSVSMFVESWMHGSGGKFHTNCISNYKVYNVREVSINGIGYSEEVDHSKWAVSASQSQPMVCIGDINRMVTQMRRGGGSLCVFDVSIWKAFAAIVKNYEPCPRLDFIL